MKQVGQPYLRILQGILVSINFVNAVVLLGFEASEYPLHEGTSAFEVCAILKGGRLDRPVDVTLFSSDRTALAPSDYVRLSATNFGPSDGNAMCVDVTVIDDSLVERNETFTLALVSNDTAVYVTSQTTAVVIVDNDQVAFGFVHNTYTANEGQEQVEISIQLLGGQGLEREVVVSLESSDGTAVASSGDYVAFRKPLTFPQGSLPGTIVSLMVDIVDDNLVEDAEYFIVHSKSIDSAVRSEIGRENTTIFIKDDDCEFCRSPCTSVVIFFLFME